jgi:hypothetical protein
MPYASIKDLGSLSTMVSQGVTPLGHHQHSQVVSALEVLAFLTGCWRFKPKDRIGMGAVLLSL